MCGIAGYYSLTNRFSEEDLRGMARKLAHRGPDAEGLYTNHSIGLAHKRLSVIDLSKEANQPMFSRCRRYVITLNGEIYNFLEIKQELIKQQRIQFRTNSDTEALLEGFAFWGTEVFAKTRGMFAAAIFDIKEQALYVVRDRLGIKPLYFYKKGGDFAFASELKALTTVPAIRHEASLNKEAINDYLHLGYIQEPHSIYAHIQKFPAGCWGRITQGKFETKRYWSAGASITETTIDDEAQATYEFKKLLADIVREHLICDVSYGAFLSGGIDSSLITAFAHKLSAKPLHTFSVGFYEKEQNESAYAREVANYLGTKHHELFVSEKEAIELVPQLGSIYDEPFADSSAVPTYLISKLTQQHVTVALSGDGGDELFMGYGAYRWARRLQNPLVKLLSRPASALFALGNSRYKRVGHLLNMKGATDKRSHIFSQEQYLFSEKEVQSLLIPDFVCGYNKSHSNEEPLARHLSSEEVQALYDINAYLKDDLLVKVDRASMQHALEVRVPFLDHRLVEFALNVNPKLKLKGKTSKYLLKKVLYENIPANLFDRPKAGFSIPLEKWMRHELKPFVYDNLSASNLHKFQIVKPEKLASLLSLFDKPQYAYLYNRIWALALLHDFLSKQ